jgi:hypothetical protein
MAAGAPRLRRHGYAGIDDRQCGGEHVCRFGRLARVQRY